ncbi:TIGR04255 family protein [Mesorhizobium sp. M0138]|uniref:TIGR04255 family protein n=1 Tax=Mesorhizobium sp. M0138 TaxID=2956891 RepID=UPI003335CEA7
MSRPDGLPDFACPPLEEVVLGVQFSRHPQYDDSFAWEVWEAFRSEFPTFQQRPRLDPMFEVFGGSETMASFQFSIAQTEPSKRYWFVAQDDSHLLQFQDDRLLLNWRRRPGNDYPRYEAMSALFEKYLDQLKSLFYNRNRVELVIQQAEVAYINVIPLVERTNLGDWLRLVQPSSLNIEQLNAIFTEVVHSDKTPIARLHYEIGLLSSRELSRGMRLTLTYRGAPKGSKTQTIIEFLGVGRERIVNRFCDITTEEAHKIWQRKQ